MHPIFDSLVYPWHIEVASRFYAVLCQAYQETDEIDIYYRQCGVYAVELPTINTAQANGPLWKDVLEKLSGKTRLKKLTEILRQNSPAQQVEDIIQEIEDTLSVIDPRVMHMNLVILDRAELRGNLELLAMENDPVKVLLIKGGPKSGKTYSRHLFELMAKQQGADIVYLYKFVVVELRDVLEELFSTAGNINAIPDGDTTQPGWYGKACRKLRDTAAANSKQLWVAIDDLGFIEEDDPAGGVGVKKLISVMDPEIRDFFIQFVQHMSSPAFRKHFKLMLIDYPPGKLPTGWYVEHLKEETLQEADILQTHVEDQIQRWCQANKKHILPAHVSSAALGVINAADNPVPEDRDKPRLERIKEATSRVLKTL